MQAQLDTLIPPVCPESHSSRSSSSLEHSAEETMSSVVCGETHRNSRVRVLLPLKDISALAGRSSCPPAPIYHSESIIFHSVYHSSLYVPSTSADNCFPSPSAPCLGLFIAPLLLHRPQSMDPPSLLASTYFLLLICAQGWRRREGQADGFAGYTWTSHGFSPCNSDLSRTPPSLF